MLFVSKIILTFAVPSNKTWGTYRKCFSHSLIEDVEVFISKRKHEQHSFLVYIGIDTYCASLSYTIQVWGIVVVCFYLGHSTTFNRTFENRLHTFSIYNPRIRSCTTFFIEQMEDSIYAPPELHLLEIAVEEGYSASKDRGVLEEIYGEVEGEW